MKRIFDTQLIGPFAAMVIVAVIVSLTTERFLNPGNLSNLSLQVSIVALIAIGSTIVIFAAGIDLSSGSMVALLTMILAQVSENYGYSAEPRRTDDPYCRGRAWAFYWDHHRLWAHPFFHHHIGRVKSRFEGWRLHSTMAPLSSRLTPRLNRFFYGKLAGVPLPFFLFGILLCIGCLCHELYQIGPRDLCSRRQSGCSPFNRYQCAQSAGNNLCDSRFSSSNSYTYDL